MTKLRPTRPVVPGTVWALGLVSLCMDASSELIHALLPVFMVTTLGAGMATVGLVEGFAEATAMVARLFSGALSDAVGRRKPLVLIGYGLAAATKPLFALAGSIEIVFVARFVDRVGKGIRGAPRDALVADVTPTEARGAAFGLRQSLDTVGAVLGPIAAIALMVAFAGDIRRVLWMAAIPAAIAVVVLVVAVREPERASDSPQPAGARVPLRLADLERLPSAFWIVIVVAGLMTLARFSEAFLILKALGEGLSATLTPIVLVVMSAVYALAAYPAGVLADRFGRIAMLASGAVVLVAADLVLASTDGIAGALLGTALWGLHMGLTQGVLSAMVADAAPADLRGTGFGVFSLGSGLFLLAASLIAGFAWDAAGPPATFLAGAAFAGLALAAMLALSRGKGGADRMRPG